MPARIPFRASTPTTTLALILAGAASCAMPDDAYDPGDVAELAPSALSYVDDAAVWRTAPSSDFGTDANNWEYCRVPAAKLADGTYTANRQLKIYRDTGTPPLKLTGLCTVYGTGNSDGKYSMMLNSKGAFAERVLLAGEGSLTEVSGVRVSIDSGTAAAPVLSDAITAQSDLGAPSANRVVEYLVKDPWAQLVYAAPHPTDKGTTEMAKRAYNADPSKSAIWAVGINAAFYSYSGRAFHITTTRLSPQSFPGLAALLANKVPYTVSFHSNVSCSQAVLVGGAMPLLFRQGIKEIIQNKFPSLYIDTAGCSGNEGTSPTNASNTMAQNGYGVHIESNDSVVSDVATRDGVSDAIRSVYDCLLDIPDAKYPSLPPGDIAASTGDASYASGASCPRFILDLPFIASTALTDYSLTPASCAAGDKAHLDFYVLGSTGRFDRVGGGNVTFDAACAMTYLSGYAHPGSSPGSLAGLPSGGDLRIVATASSSAGTAKALTVTVH